MFTADLSWTDPHTEKVGERKERIAKKKEKERSISSAAPSINSVRSVKSSIFEGRELWWPSSFKKARSIKPTSKSRDTSYGSTRTRLGSTSLPKTLEVNTANIVRDPTLQPSWTYSTTLSPTLPSGASLEAHEYEVPELEGDISSRGTESSGSRSSHERRWGWKSPAKINAIDEALEVNQVRQPVSVNAERVESTGRGTKTSPTEKKKKKKLYAVRVEGCLDLKSLQLQDEMLRQQHPEEFGLPMAEQGSPYATSFAGAETAAWKPPSRGIVLSSPREPSREKERDSNSAAEETTPTHGSPVELMRFQRFIRRMESAGPKIILDRVKEEWTNPVDEEACEEMILEKQLWVLTAFQLENLGRYSRFPKANTGKILELYGNLSEVYQLSAMYPRQKVHYLTTRPQPVMRLPENVSYWMVAEPGMIPLPYPDSSFSHIRASTLPSIVPSSKLPQIFQECYRLLASGGMLEIRIMDAAPVRKTAGPRMKAWIEDRLSVNLERMFRCSKPCTLVPGWLSDAGFDLPASLPSQGEENVKLRCAFDRESSDVDRELSTMVGRALWKDIWGGFVDEDPDEPHWWWEDEEVMKECLERDTVFECGSIFAFKK